MKTVFHGRVSSSLVAVAVATFGLGMAAGCAADATGEVQPEAQPETGPCDCGVFSVVGNMVEERYSHTALGLADGTVVVVGGNDDDGSLLSVERYSPETNASAFLSPLPVQPRFGVQLHQLDASTVVAFYSGSDAALYDLDADAWTTLPSARLGHNRAATVVSDAGVFLIGGASFPFVDRLDLDTETWEELPNLLYGRESHTATELEDGRFLIVGGYDSTQFINQGATEVFDPATGTSAEAGTLAIPRQLHAAVRLDDGRVLIAGGFGPDIALATASTEIYDPASNTWESAGELPGARVAHTLTKLDDGRVVAIGGIDPSLGAPYSDAAIFVPEINRWRPLTEGMVRSRQGHAAVKNGDAILVFGGNESGFNAFAAANDEVEQLTVQ